MYAFKLKKLHFGLVLGSALFLMGEALAQAPLQSSQQLEVVRPCLPPGETRLEVISEVQISQGRLLQTAIVYPNFPRWTAPEAIFLIQGQSCSNLWSTLGDHNESRTSSLPESLARQFALRHLQRKINLLGRDKVQTLLLQITDPFPEDIWAARKLGFQIRGAGEE